MPKSANSRFFCLKKNRIRQKITGECKHDNNDVQYWEGVPRIMENRMGNRNHHNNNNNNRGAFLHLIDGWNLKQQSKYKIKTAYMTHMFIFMCTKPYHVCYSRTCVITVSQNRRPEGFWRRLAQGDFHKVPSTHTVTCESHVWERK